MTRDEIQELIEYLEKNYHVKCLYIHQMTTRDGMEYPEKLIITPDTNITFQGLRLDKDVITNKLDKLDLIRF